MWYKQCSLVLPFYFSTLWWKYCFKFFIKLSMLWTHMPWIFCTSEPTFPTQVLPYLFSYFFNRTDSQNYCIPLLFPSFLPLNFLKPSQSGFWIHQITEIAFSQGQQWSWNDLILWSFFGTHLFDLLIALSQSVNLFFLKYFIILFQEDHTFYAFSVSFTSTSSPLIPLNIRMLVLELCAHTPSFSVYTPFLGEHIQMHGFKCHLSSLVLDE